MQRHRLAPLSPPRGGRGDPNSAAAPSPPLSSSCRRPRAWPVKARRCQRRRGWSPSVLGTARVVSFMARAWCGRGAPWRGCSPACGGASRGNLKRWLRGGWEARRRQRRSWRSPEAAAWPALRGSLIASPRLDSKAWSGATLGSSEPEVAPLDPFAGSQPTVWGLLVRHE
jgi:hypothetical protein